MTQQEQEYIETLLTTLKLSNIQYKQSSHKFHDSIIIYGDGKVMTGAIYIHSDYFKFTKLRTNSSIDSTNIKVVIDACLKHLEEYKI